MKCGVTFLLISGRRFGRGSGCAWGYGRASGRDSRNVTDEIEALPLALDTSVGIFCI